MAKFINKLKLLTFICLWIGLPAFGVQSTINFPNSEILEENTILLKQVASTYPNNQNGTLIPSVNYGVGHNTEVSVGVPVGFTYSGVFNQKLALETKSVWTKHNTRFTVGGGVFPYLNGGTTEGFVYSHVTQVISKTKTNISVGGYATGQQEFLNDGGIVLILEQSLTDKIKLLGEYTSGNTTRANFAAGLKYKAKNDLAITGAVIIPTDHGIGFQIIISKFIFPKKKQ